MHSLRKNSVAVLVVGLVIGAAVGLHLRGLVTVPLHASATQGMDNFAIATGLIDNRVEGLYFLDYLTGELKCAVMNPKTGKFNSFFSYNVAADFAASDNPKYLMVTGLVDMPRGRAGYQIPRSLVYVAEANSGEVAAYTVPWNSSAQAAGKPQSGEFVPLDKKSFRTTVLRGN